MRRVAMIGLVVGACAGSALAETFTFPHIFEISGRLVNTPLGSVEIPYQASFADADISITPAVTPPTVFDYDYETTPSFNVDLGTPRTKFAVLLRGGGGQSDPDPEDESLWNLTMRYQPIAVIGGVEYRLPGDGFITFVKPHSDSQPLPVEEDEENLRHGTPVVFLIDSPITLYAEGDSGSESFLTIDAASRIVIQESVPAPAAGIGLAVLGVLGAGCRRRGD